MGTALSVPCTTKLAQTTSQYYCVLQSLQKVLPSTTLYYRACTKYFPVLLCTTKLAQTTSHTKLAQSTSQYYFVIQSLHTESFYTQQAFKHSKRLHTERLHAVLLHMASFYTHRNFYTEKRLHTEKLLHTASFYTQNLLHTASFYRKNVFTQRSFLVHCTKSQSELQLQSRISAPMPKKDDFEALFERKIASAKSEKIC